MKARVVFFLITIFCFGVIASDIVVALEQKKFISMEKADEIMNNDEGIRLVRSKWASSSGETIPPGPDKPYYTFVMEHKTGGDYSAYATYEQFTVRVDACTGKISYPPEMEARIAAIKKSKENMELEKPFKKKLEGISEKLRRASYAGKEKCQPMPLILEALNKETPDIRSAGLRILCQFADYQTREQMPVSGNIKEAIPRVVELLKDENYGVRYNAAEALAAIGDKKDEVLIKALVPLINDTDGLVRRGAVKSLSILGDASLAPTFISLLENSGVTQEAIAGLGRLKDERAVEPLIKLFNNKEFFYTEQDIIAALGEIKNKQAVPFLISILNKSYTQDVKSHSSFKPLFPYVGSDAARALTQIGKDAIPSLKQSLRSGDRLTRLYASYALGLQKDPAALSDLKETEEKETDVAVRNYMAQAIAEIKGEKYESPLLQQLKVRTEAAKLCIRPLPVIVSLVIQNTGSTAIVINSSGLSSGSCPFEIIRPDGGFAEYIGPMYSDKTSFFPSAETLITLEPGKSRRFGPYKLSARYAFDKRGKYKVTGFYSMVPYGSGVEFGVYALVGTVKSEPAVIEVR